LLFTIEYCGWRPAISKKLKKYFFSANERQHLPVVSLLSLTYGLNLLLQMTKPFGLLAAAMLTVMGTAAQYAKYERFKAIIDAYYYNGPIQKSKQLADSIEPFIKRDAGANSVYYGAYVCEYQGMVDDKAGDFKAAELHYKKGMEIIRQAVGEDEIHFMEACVNLGNMYYVCGLYQPALEYTLKGRHLLQATGNTKSEAFAASGSNLANIYAARWEFEQAENYFDSTAALMASYDEKDSMIRAKKYALMNNRAALYYKSGDFERADYYYRKALQLSKDVLLPTNPEQHHLLSNYGNNLRHYGQHTHAKEVLQQVKDKLEKDSLMNPRLAMTVTSNLIETYRDGGQLDSCLLMGRQALTDFLFCQRVLPIPYNTLRINLARTLMQLKQWNGAREILESLLAETATAEREDNLENRRATLYYSAELSLHTRNYATAVTMADSLYGITAGMVLNNYGAMAENDKLLFISLIYQVQIIYTSAFYKTGMKDKALLAKLYKVYTGWKGLLLQKQAAFLTGMRSGSNNSELYAAWKSNRQFLYNQYKLPAEKRHAFTDSIAAETDKMERRLQQENDKNTASGDEASIKTTAPVNLGGHQAVIEYVRFGVADSTAQVYQMHYGAFVTAGSQQLPQWIYLCSESELAAALGIAGSAERVISNSIFSTLLIDPRLRKPGKLYPGDRLYQLLLKPVMPFLRGVNTLYCITEGLVAQLPLHALPFSNKRFLADDFSIRYLLNKQSFLANNKAVAPLLTCSICGDMQYGNYRTKPGGAEGPVWDKLPWSRYEIKQAAAWMKKRYNTTMYAGAAATEERFRNVLDSAGAGILHLSTHGYFHTAKVFLDRNTISGGMPYLREVNPLLHCGLVMTGAKNDHDTLKNGSNDGLLTGYEISTLPLSQTSLVVLSACETGLGNIWQSEGVFGLQRAFKLAGAQKIMMSLWKVPDRETAELMTAFYKSVSLGRPVETAYRHALLYMRKKYPSPYFWAGFILVE
jgi:CHAT domain-containing protein/Tfp pilus assembly protein PilF